MIRNWIIATFWKNQNWIGKIQSIFIVLLVLLMIYYKSLFGIYKHKYVSKIESEKERLTVQVDSLKAIKSRNTKQIKKNVSRLRIDKNKIETKRKKDEELINNSSISDKQRNAILSKYESR
ncbi:hypothetical protein [Tenacibaculum piscium]|uniref:hypothetical protein n=1 Tax=Tenacibaculum piscium TaxID=1458515 RepID=UPI00187B8A2E|nr:hypothetical protein [Tenacibaculum piscium]MBE7691132.1 hypothetical protein [Tenacibaculum piscium]